MKYIAIVTLCVLLVGCASGPNFKPGAGSYADAASTAYALEVKGFSEANPVLSWIDNPMGVAVASIGMKWGAKYILHNELGVEAYDADTYIETAGIWAGGWNVALVLGASNPASAVVGTGVAWLYYDYRMNSQYEERYSYLSNEIATQEPP